MTESAHSTRPRQHRTAHSTSRHSANSWSRQ